MRMIVVLAAASKCQARQSWCHVRKHQQHTCHTAAVACNGSHMQQELDWLLNSSMRAPHRNVRGYHTVYFCTLPRSSALRMRP